MTSVPGNLANGKTASFTDICSILTLLSLKSDNFFPVIIKAAILTRGMPIDLATKGIVLLPLGFTSKMKIFLSCIANCILIKPITFNSLASLFVWSIMFLIISFFSV